MKQRVKDIYRQKDYMYLCLLVVIVLLSLLVWVEYQENKIRVRAHNLNAFYLSQTCGDLPLGGDTNEEACEMAIGEFMLLEKGLFTR